MLPKNTRIEENGQVMIERNPGEWVHHSMRYHIRAELVDGGVRAALFDYLGQPAELSGVKVSFQLAAGEEFLIETRAGVATLLDDRPISYVYISSNYPGVDPAEIGQQPNPLMDIDLMGAQLVQQELEALELKAINAMLGAQMVQMELRLLALEGGAVDNE
ncbi:hypothetical protein D3P09_02205 [Paenibacillus pinisoli]|uniref:Uncharacterized protein n=1 Tax=Paenibacillus pinisoli TaxID=1276110 RepID=A0A3A6PI31_9BACL|nr:hypothetical protein [Paenibacillus pinisoli]RJX40857.1 hypothetical protein D3P09_02205 [Paenibacillus pinisoli]